MYKRQPLVNLEQFTPQTGPVAVKNVHILAPDGNGFLQGQTILMEGGMIVDIAPNLTIPASTKIIDGQGKYLIPGLIDSHVHLFKSPNDLLLYVANGVTEIREMIGDETKLAMKKEIANGRIGPKMWVASPPLGSIKQFSDRFISLTRGAINIDNAKEAEENVQQLYNQGYDGIKIYSHLNRESYLAATKTANALGMPVAGHIPWEASLTDFWESGQSEIAHMEEVMNALRREFWQDTTRNSDDFLPFVEERSEAIATQLLKRDISVTSTLWLTESFVRQKFDLDRVLNEIELAYVNPGMSEGAKMGDAKFGWLPEVNLYSLPEGLTEDEKVGSKKFWTNYGKACQILTKNLSNRGVKIMAGTDANLPPTVPGFSLHDELISLNRAGMTPAQVLRAATSLPAQWLKSKTGEISVGFNANLVLLDKNPLMDIRHTKTINTVFSNGKIYNRALLDQLLAAVKKVNDECRTVDVSQYNNQLVQK